MFWVDKLKYEHLAIISNLKSCQFAPRLVILYMLPIWGFADYFANNNSYEPSQHLTVTNEGSFFAENFSLSFGT